ncbi:MAG: hypothetical protein IIA77_06170 [Proteobacteria bacterium]|nr:hypothetical protein [Pseudomonadota bacterium]
MDVLIKIFPYFCTLLLVGCALFTLLRNARQGHATFLLQLDARWENMEGHRKAVFELRNAHFKNVMSDHSSLSDCHRIKKLRDRYKEAIKDKADNDPETFRKFIIYLGFFETVGLMVQKKYMPFNEVLRLYKGPILDIDLMFIDYIKDWQMHADVEEGLFENIIYLVKKVRRQKLPFTTRWFGWLCWWSPGRDVV